MVIYIDQEFEPAAKTAQDPAFAEMNSFAESLFAGSEVLLDVDRAAMLFSLADSNESRTQALLAARVNFMGTDGIRGKIEFENQDGPAPGIDDAQEGNPFRLLAREHRLARGLVECAAEAFASLLIEEGILKADDRAAAGSDGRDAANNRSYEKAMCEGFLKQGLRVDFLGTLPTPYVPLYMLENGIRGGAMLTASHNPANQNGIKFFLDGRKLLPEGRLGEYALSARMFAMRPAANLEARPREQQIPRKAREVRYETGALKFLDRLLRGEDYRRLGGMPFLLDTANGAYHDIASEWLRRSGIPHICINEKPNGSNINRHCGVAEIEGLRALSGAEALEGAAVLRSLVLESRKAGLDGFAAALDGDGDRGFVLHYSLERDTVTVLDGDMCGIRIAELEYRRREKDGSLPRTPQCVFTVESDIMASVSLKERLPVETATVDVGDKWICNHPGESMIAGMESSGHVIIPVQVKTPDGTKTLRAGNGFLSCMLALKHILEENDPDAIAPFSPGCSKTVYTYFVDKSKFSPGSAVWKKDIETAEAFFAERKAAGDPAFDGLEIRREEKETRDILFWGIYGRNGLAAALFSRNSGTENKNAVYLKCLASLEAPLSEALSRLKEIHRKGLRDEASHENALSELILARIEERGSATQKELNSFAENAKLDPVLHALKKEERIAGKGGSDEECVWTIRG